ncbi:DNA adenine methylase [Gordonia zhenghanii]|uniref:DNA adenine methylase n=1 Tax=Gordonia zhenghanii TaxID=2911516 RepID=UPI0035573D38
MGSKSALLRGELGEILVASSAGASRFVDLFSGSGSVSHYVAENINIPVLSVDLQHYSKILAESITGRDCPQTDGPIINKWTADVGRGLLDDAIYEALREPIARLGKATVLRSRRSSERTVGVGFVTQHYGGHYFSPQQAYSLDRLYEELPKEEPDRTLCLAALLHTASICAAAPGHTAQPFQPTPKLLPYIKSAWSRDPVHECQRQVSILAARHAKVKGQARVGDALEAVSSLGDEDLVFCDPPYSAVQYSRFYHVLEGISRGGWNGVFGAGRSPARGYRESSDFSMKAQASSAMAQLLSALRERSCRVLVTFPDADASNGLSSSDIVALAGDSWHVREHYVDSTHSTLGGSSSQGGRGGRRALKEAVLLFEPRTAIISLLESRRPERQDVLSVPHTSEAASAVATAATVS